MHPWMAFWIWSEAMRRAAFSIPTVNARDEALLDNKTKILLPSADVIRAENYLQTGLIDHPLPDILLDRLADLYWTEREAELPI